MIMDFVYLGVGIALAIAGGEVFVRGIVALASWARVPAGIIAATVAAFATSAPELSVSVLAALDGQPELATGNALGSNVVNIGLVMGPVLLIGLLRVNRDDLKRDLPMTLLAPLVTWLLILDGNISRSDGVVLLALFFVWLGFATWQAWKARQAADLPDVPQKRALAVLFVLLGLAILIVSGQTIVLGAQGIGPALGLEPFVIGATLVAFGTSAPEMATAIISRLRGHHDVGIGTILGSNIFNGLWIVGIAVLIAPVEQVGPAVLLSLVFAVVLTLLLIPGRSLTLGRPRGVVLIAIYALYVVITIQFNDGSLVALSNLLAALSGG